ncbi:MAG: pilus assembly protein CpaC [Rhizobiales bacterium]|nr:pilus assembly protein CpaC [Hyphomicrobiales bacterium]
MMLVAAAPGRSDAEALTVVLDQAKLVKVPDRIATLVIGNPLIADAALQAGGTIVLTGKGYGTTNLIALDRGGRVLMEKTVRVAAPKESVFVFRGTERQTYSCTPKCERQIMLGDSDAAFAAILGQTAARNGQAQGAAR